MPTKEFNSPATSPSDDAAATRPTRRTPRAGLPPKPPLGPPGTVKLWASLRRLWDSVVPVARPAEVLEAAGPAALPAPEPATEDTNDKDKSLRRGHTHNAQSSQSKPCPTTPRSSSISISRRWRGADRNGTGDIPKDKHFARSASSPPKTSNSRTLATSPPPPNRRLRIRSSSSNAIQTRQSYQHEPPTNSSVISPSSKGAQKSKTTRQFKPAAPQPAVLSRSSSLRDVSSTQTQTGLVVPQKQESQKSTTSDSTASDVPSTIAGGTSLSNFISDTAPKPIEKDNLSVSHNITDMKKGRSKMETIRPTQNRRSSFNPVRAQPTTVAGAALTLSSSPHSSSNETSARRPVQNANDSSPKLSKDNHSRRSSIPKNSKSSATDTRRQWARVSAKSRLLMLSGSRTSQNNQEIAKKNNRNASVRDPRQDMEPSPLPRNKSVSSGLKRSPSSATKLTRRKSATSVTESSARKNYQVDPLNRGDRIKTKDRSAPGNDLVKFKSAVVYGTKSSYGAASSGRSSLSGTSSTRSDAGNPRVNSQATKKSVNRSRALPIQRNKFSDASLEVQTNTNQLCTSLPNIIVNIPPMALTSFLANENTEKNNRMQKPLLSELSDNVSGEIHSVEREVHDVNDEFEADIRETDLSPLIRPSPNDASSLKYIRPASYIRHIMTEKSRTALSAPGSPRGSGLFVGIPMHSPTASPPPSRKLKLTSVESSSSDGFGILHKNQKGQAPTVFPHTSLPCLPKLTSSRLKLPPSVDVTIRDKRFALTRLAARRSSDCIPCKSHDSSFLSSSQHSLIDRWNVEMRLSRLQTLVRQLRERRLSALPDLRLPSTVKQLDGKKKTNVVQAKPKNMGASRGIEAVIRKNLSIQSRPSNASHSSEIEESNDRRGRRIIK